MNNNLRLQYPRLLLLAIVALCGCARQRELSTRSQPLVCEGADYIAFKVDTVWAYVGRNDSSAVRYILPLLRQGFLRGEWLSTPAGCKNLHFTRVQIELKSDRWATLTSTDSLQRRLDPRMTAAYIWSCQSKTEKDGLHYDFNVFPYPNGGTGLYKFRLSIRANGSTIDLICMGIQI